MKNWVITMLLFGKTAAFGQLPDMDIGRVARGTDVVGDITQRLYTIEGWLDDVEARVVNIRLLAQP